MTPALLLCSLLVFSAAPASRSRSPASRRQAGQEAFARGDFETALRALDAAALETNDGGALAKIHLLRGQSFAAMRDFNGTEEAFLLALDYDPTAQLDPARVDPALVRTLDRLRDRLKGELLVRTDPPGAKVFVDSRLVGVTPYKGSVPVGSRKVEAQAANGTLVGVQEVVVFAKRTTSVQVSLSSVSVPSTVGMGEETAFSLRAFRPLADLRGVFTPFGAGPDAAFEVGGGAESQWLRASLSFQLVPDFGVTPRGAVVVPLREDVQLYAELEIPVIFDSDVAFGLGGSGGGEYVINRWIGLFGQLGVRHYFTGPRTGRDDVSANQLTLQVGARFRIPRL
ncbi:MAG TPA: PEGA domain-containing protein [Myxococcaceae bacterium]|nr:PEGA domain-containing protein [Myxococcaceae bacterium]